MIKKFTWILLLGSSIAHASKEVPNPNNVPVDPRLRQSSYPYLSGDTFRAFCNHIFDETEVIFDVTKIALADTVFVRNDVLHVFFGKYHPRIQNPYILITHNNDFPNPGAYAHYLDDHTIIAWFAQNADCVHKKLIPIPIGLPDHFWPHGKTAVMQEVQRHAIGLSERKNATVFLNFNLHTNLRARRPIWQYFEHQPYCLVRANQSQKEYLYDMNRCTFVISPPGNALDCHRTWEALYLGCIPIVQHSSLDPLFNDLPVILIADWSIVNPDFLQKKLREIKEKKFNWQKLYAEYWFEQIRAIQRAARKNSPYIYVQEASQ